MPDPMPSLSYQFAELFGIHGLLNRMQNSQKNYVRKKMGKMLAGRMYADYRRNHPECVGRYTSCCACGGSRIWAKKLVSALDGSVSEHCCRDCGEQLFFSITGSMLKELFDEEKKQDALSTSKHADIMNQ